MLIRLLAIVALCFSVAACAPSYRYYEGSSVGVEGDYYYSDPYYSDSYYALPPSFSGYGYRYSYDPFFRGGFYYGMNRYPYHYGWGPRFGYAAGFGYPYGYGGYSSFYYGYHYLSPPRRVGRSEPRSAREEAERLARADRGEAAGIRSRSTARSLRPSGGPRGRDAYRNVSYGVQAVPSGFGYSQPSRYPSSARPAMSARSEARLRYRDATGGSYRGSAGMPTQRTTVPQSRQSQGTPARAQSAPVRSYRSPSYRAPQRSAPVRSSAPPARSSRGPSRVTEEPPRQ